MGESNSGSTAQVSHPAVDIPLPHDVPFSTWTRCFDALARSPEFTRRGFPLRTASLPRSADGGQRAGFVRSLHSFKLLTADGRAKPALLEALASSEATKELVSRLLTSRLRWAVAQGASLSQEELEEEFRARGVPESVLDRVVKFYIDARRFSGMEVSPLWRGARGPKKRPTQSEREPRCVSTLLRQVGLKSLC